MKSILVSVILGLVAASGALAARSDFPQPKTLEPDVAFWKRIYSEVGTDGGLIHDTHDLSLVYEVVKFPSRHASERHTEARKRYYQGILRTLAAGKRTGLTNDERRVLALFGDGVTNARLRLASERLRFQLGQADKFRAGVVRSGAYMDHIRGILRDMNLPLEIAHLPHVESSFTPNIYSRVGAAGLWQFTSATGRRFMRVDHIVDERLDPYRASLAAARLLEQNYRVTGSWPLAITAYNHGASGMRRAAQQLGTRDIARIVRQYRSRTFGFASRNFYVEFLAADHVASNHERYFGKLALHEPIEFETVTIPFYARARDVASALGVDTTTLEEVNPSLRPGVWRNSNFVPKGFKLRVPSHAVTRPLEQAIAAIPDTQRYANQPSGGYYVVRRGDTLSKIASRHGISTRRLASMNGIRKANQIRVGQRLKVPTRESIAPIATEEPRETLVAATPTRPDRSPVAEPRPGATTDTKTGAVTGTKTSLDVGATDVAAAETESLTYTVRRGDTLTAIARAHGLSVAEIAAINGLGNRHAIRAGQRLQIVKPIAPAAPPSAPDAATETQIAKVDLPLEASPPPRAPVASDAAKQAAPAAPPAATTVAQKPAPPAVSPARTAAAAPEAAPVSATAPPSAAPAVALAERDDTPEVDDEPTVGATWDPDDESATDPSPGLLADPSDYTVAADRTIVVQPNETLGHYAEWLGVRASRLRELNGMRYGQPVEVQRKIRLDFANVSPADFERIRVEYHRQLQEDFFAEWEIDGTTVHKVGRGDSIWSLSTRRFAVPIWLLRQYNPDVDLDALSTGTPITVPKLRQRNAESSARDVVGHTATAG